jgi:salicylate hydroxylase
LSIRNGRCGTKIHEVPAPIDVPRARQTCRLTRSKLQSALLKNVDKTHVHVGKRLMAVEQLHNKRVRLVFEGNAIDEVDVLVAADGIRSVCRSVSSLSRQLGSQLIQLIRQTQFPNSTLSYSGQCVYRTIVSRAKAACIEGIPNAPVFWKSVSGLYVYTCPLGNDDFEVTARIRRHKTQEDQVSWGKRCSLRDLLPEFDDFCQPVREILGLAADEETQEYVLLSGPPLSSMTDCGNIAFVGDAAHAFCGNFGAGTGFALEDVFTLGKCLAWAYHLKEAPAEGLRLYDQIRSPHYNRLNALLNRFAKVKNDLSAENLPIDEEIKTRILRIAQASETWMYYYDIETVVRAEIEEAENNAKNGTRADSVTDTYT